MRSLDKLTGLTNTGGQRLPNKSKLLTAISGLLLAALLSLSGCTAQTATPVINVSTPTSTASANLSSPEIIQFDIKNNTLSASGLAIDIQAKILNPNAVKLEMDNIEISTTDVAGNICTQDTFPGGSIEAASSQSYDFAIDLPQKYLAERELTLKMATQAVNTSSALAVESNAKINVSDILDSSLTPPEFTLEAHITRIAQVATQTLVEAKLEGTFNNPNPVDLNFSLIRTSIKSTLSGQALKSEDIKGNVIPANSSYPFSCTFYLPLDVMGETTLQAYADASVQITNYNKSVKDTYNFSVPELADVIQVPQITLEVEPQWDYGDSSEYHKIIVTAEIQNDNEFDLTIEDFELTLYDTEDNDEIASLTMSNEVIQGVPASSTRKLINQFSLTQDELGKRGMKASFTGYTEIGVEGVYGTIPLNVEALYELER